MTLLIAGLLGLATVIALVGLIATSATPAVSPVVLSFVGSAAGVGPVLARVLLVVASALVAGPVLVGAPRVRVVAPAAGVAITAAAVTAGIGDAAWWAALAHAALVGAVLVLRSFPTAGRVASVLLTVAVAVEIAIVRWGAAMVLELLAAVVLVVALGLTVRASRYAVIASAAATALGVVLLVVEGPWTVSDLLGGTARGPVVLAQLLLPLLAGALSLAAAHTSGAGNASLLAPSDSSAPSSGGGTPATHDVVSLASGDSSDALPARGRATRRRELVRVAAGALGLGLAAVAVLGALPTSPQSPEPGRLLVRPVTVAGQSMALFVAPTAGGPTLIRLSSAPSDGPPSHSMGAMGGMHGGHDMPGAGWSIAAGGQDATFAPRDGAPGRWALLDVPADTRELTLTGPGGTATVPVVIGPTGPADPAVLAGPDGPECADALLGDLLGGGRGVACPSTALSPADARALTLAVTDLRGRGLPSLFLVGDDSPRSRAADALVRDTAARIGLPVSAAPTPDDGLLVTSGWAQARRTLTGTTEQATRTPTFTGGVFLAPWLLTSGVLSAGASTMLPLGFTPQEAEPRGYAALLTTISDDAAPSSSGYLAWAREQGRPDGDVRLFGAATIDVMPGMPGMNHGDRAGAWLPGGALVPMSGPLS
ncbi:hypothetical protein [Actinomycetospora soli]|uniref:hypothetical protein n=1 Tax=Actinomycetospora soli TaxID=2893887 RepID=UPI001E2CE119|nr:hypothetical protein [Actinomycetospora soli]MCD2186769.1 hypothetical protein [Actinomycetospora soli]